jgi:uncharacterized linocin/CFP29 family protein
MNINVMDVNSSQGRSLLDTYKLRPWVDTKTGRVFITHKDGKHKAVDRIYPSMQTYGTLRRDEWKQLDETVIATRKDRLQGIQALIDAGLVKSLNNAMGITEYEWHQKSVDAGAHVSMSPTDRGRSTRPVYDTQYTPVPIIMSDFDIDARELELSRNMGRDIQTDMVEDATRAVNQELENMLFTTGDGYQLETNKTIPSLLSTSYSSTGSLINKWDDSATSSENIKDDVMNMLADARSNKFFGPFMLFIPKSYELAIQDDYDVSGASRQTIQQRLLAINDLDRIVAVDTLPADTVLLVQMSPETVRLLDGMGPQVVEWQADGPYVTNYKVIRIAVPQIRWTKDDVTGIVKYTSS